MKIIKNDFKLLFYKKKFQHFFFRFFSTQNYFISSIDPKKIGLELIPNFINEEEQDILITEVDSILKKRKYEDSHWVFKKYRCLFKKLFLKN